MSTRTTTTASPPSSSSRLPASLPPSPPGAHTLGSKGYGDPVTFDNEYYKSLLRKPWLDPKDPMASMIGLPSDHVLPDDPDCKPFIAKYAADQVRRGAGAGPRPACWAGLGWVCHAAAAAVLLRALLVVRSPRAGRQRPPPARSPTVRACGLRVPGWAPGSQHAPHALPAAAPAPPHTPPSHPTPSLPQAAFFRDFEVAYVKLASLGVTWV